MTYPQTINSATATPGKPLPPLGKNPRQRTLREHVVLVVDSNENSRRELCDIVLRLLGSLGKIKILEVSTFASATAAIAECKAALDLIIIDPYLPDATCTTVVEQVEKVWRGVPIVVVSAMEDSGMPLRLLKTGVLGFIPKSSNIVEEMTKGLRLILSGTRYFPDHVLLALTEKTHSTSRDSSIPEREVATKSLARHPIALSPRQTEVLHLILKGYANKEIARELGISVGTAKNHVAAILRALRVDTRAKAVLRAIGHGFNK